MSAYALSVSCLTAVTVVSAPPPPPPWMMVGLKRENCVKQLQELYILIWKSNRGTIIWSSFIPRAELPGRKHKDINRLWKATCSDHCRQKKDHRRSLDIRKFIGAQTSYASDTHQYHISYMVLYTRMPLGGITAECTQFGVTKTRNKATI